MDTESITLEAAIGLPKHALALCQVVPRKQHAALA